MTSNASVQQFKVLVADPGGRLKLARWRLHSDGYEVYYVKDLIMIEPLIRREEIQIILFNVSGNDDLEVLKKISNIKCSFQIIAVAGVNTGHLLKMISALGVKKIISRPIDYPQLSAVVREELEGIKERKRKRNAFKRFKKIITGSITNRTVYSAVLDQLKTGVLVIDETGQITFINQTMSLLLDVDNNSVLGKPFEEVLAHPASPIHDYLLVSLQSALRNREISYNTVTPYKPEDPVFWEIKAYPVFEHNNEFAGAYVIVEDVTSPRKMEKVMVQSEKLAMVGQLAAGAAHEIRNPLTSVRGFIQLLQSELKGTPKAGYINIIIAEIDRVNTIVNEFLKLAKPVVPNRKASNLKKLFKDIHVLIESEAILKNINITIDIPESLPLVQIDREQIKQVIINIIRNSFEAMAEGATITVRAHDFPAEREVSLEISDSGEGMDEEMIKQIFTPFFTTKENGTGLGLAVSSEIMKSHGGRIEAKSKKDCGTTMYLYFPY